MEYGLTSESSSTSSDGSNDFLSNLPMSDSIDSMSDSIACEPALPTLPRIGDGTALPFNQPPRNFGSSSSYHLPTSNLPQDFRLESSSRVQFPQMQQLNSQNQQFNSQIPWNDRQPQNQMNMQDPLTSFGQKSQQLPIEIVVGPPMEPHSSYPNQVIPYSFRVTDSPMQQDQTMNWNPGTPQDSSNYVPPTPDPRCIKNSLYDPMYETMGLHVDPHLRLFVAKQNKGNGN